MSGLGSLVATPGLINTAQGSIEAKVDSVRNEVTQRPKEPAIKKLLTDLLGTGTVDLRGDLTSIKHSEVDLKTGVDALSATAAEIKTEVTTGVDARLDALKTELSKEIQSKKKLGLKGFLVRAGLVVAAALPAIAYLQENGLDFNPMVGGAGQAWNDISGAVGEKWNQIFPPAEEAPATGAAPAAEATATEEAPAGGAVPITEEATGAAPAAAPAPEAQPAVEAPGSSSLWGPNPETAKAENAVRYPAAATEEAPAGGAALTTEEATGAAPAAAPAPEAQPAAEATAQPPLDASGPMTGTQTPEELNEKRTIGGHER